MHEICELTLCLLGIFTCVETAPLVDAPTAGRSLGAAALVIVFLFFTNLRPAVCLIAKLNALSDRQRRWSAMAIFFASIAYFAISAVMCERAFHPTWHDDQMHAVQVRLLSTGHLWMPPHPLHEFFDTFHIFMTPVYAPIHFPGTAILNVPGVWLHLPTGVIPLLIASAGCSVAFLLIFETLSGTAAFLTVACIWASPAVRLLATTLTSHNGMLLLGVLSLWTFLRWQRKRSIGWSIVLAVVCSLALISRPVDALAYVIPIAIGVLVDIYRAPSRRFTPLLVMVLCAMPFLGLQLWFDKAVIGHWLTPPYLIYNDIFHPFTSFGGVRPAIGAPPVHVSDLAQKQDYYRMFALATSQEPLKLGPWRSFGSTACRSR